MARKKAVAARGTLDWYAENAQSAQQWFTSRFASYWAFTLQNNSTDGTKLWVYDARSCSGPDFGAGTGNPGGNSAAQAGSSGGSGGLAPSWAFVNQTSASVNGGTSINVTAPGSLAGGDIIFALHLNSNDASKMSPPDNSWALLAITPPTANYPSVGIWGHICTTNEPGSYTWTDSGGPDLLLIQLAHFRGENNPGYADASAYLQSVGQVANMTVPAVTTTETGDLILCVLAQFNNAGTMSVPAGFTGIAAVNGASLSLQAGYKANVPLGVNGPYTASSTGAYWWTVVTIGVKPATPANAPGQQLSNPLQTVSPIHSGVLVLQFSAAPLALFDRIFWQPPANDFSWDREAPIAIVRSGKTFSIAGITPEQAAWCSMTWVNIK